MESLHLIKNEILESIHLMQNTTLEISLLIFLIYLLAIAFCLFSLSNRLGLVITYIFGLYGCYACNKEVLAQTFAGPFTLFNVLFFGLGILLLTSVVYTLIAGE